MEKIILKIISMRSDVKNAKTEKEKPEKIPVWHETDWDYFKQQQFSCPSEKKSFLCGEEKEEEFFFAIRSNVKGFFPVFVVCISEWELWEMLKED